MRSSETIRSIYSVNFRAFPQLSTSLCFANDDKLSRKKFCDPTLTKETNLKVKSLSASEEILKGLIKNVDESDGKCRRK